ncbi:MAG: 50S ribosomal protein L11 methyltransferase [Deltaproteobacteria bacterium]|nr:50S ribosomal protein L11 methyltransferase [Deltaproteobacteria bacterium]
MNPAHDPVLSPWVEVIILAPESQAEAAADFLFCLTGQGVEIREVTQPAGHQEVRAYLAAGADLASQQTLLERYAEGLASTCEEGQVLMRFQDLKGQDWSENWKQYFHPRMITRRLLVRPPWEEAPLGPETEVLIVDPGQAFGTGQHESTKLCLELVDAMAQADNLPLRVLDVGCGTGILALACLRFGAGSALALDVDPQAVEATRHNAALNGLADRVEASTLPLKDVDERFELILANLTALDLIALAGPLARLRSATGRLIVSGLLTDQADQVRAAFEAEGLKEEERASLVGWAALVLG